MKARKIVLAVLLSLILIVSAVIAVACKPDEEDNGGVVKIDMSKAADWDPLDDTETAYVIRTNSDGKLQLDYTTSNYQFVKRVFVEPVEDYQKVKKLVAKVKMTSNQSEPQLLFKVEGDDTTVEYPEVTINVTGEYKTYEWNFAKFSNADPYDLTKAARLLICADPGDANAEGSVVFDELYMSSEDIVEANRVALPHKPVVEDYTWNEITATKTSVTEWTPDANGVYTITKSGTTVKASVNKDKVDGDEYAAMIGYIYGDALKTMKSFKIDIKGPSGKTAIIKPLDYKDFKVTFDGTVQHFEFDISEQASRSDANFAQSANPQADNRVAILALDGSDTGKADIEISSASFSTEEAVTPPPAVVETVYEITQLNRKIGTDWYSATEGEYTPKLVGNTVQVSYEKKGTYSPLTAYVKGAAIAKMKSITFTLKGTKDVTLMLKPFDVNDANKGLEETKTKFTGDIQTVTIDISKYVVNKSFDERVPINIVVDYGDEGIGHKGSFEIYSVEFSTTAAGWTDSDPTSNVNVITVDNHQITKGWAPLDAGEYTVAPDGSGFNVTFDKKDQWHFLATKVKGEELSKMRGVVFTVSGTPGQVLLGKFLNVEVRKTLTGGMDYIVVDFSAKVADTDFTQEQDVLLCADEANKTSQGSFHIYAVEFFEEVPEDPAPAFVETVVSGELKTDVNKNWRATTTRLTVGTKDGHPFFTYSGKDGDYNGAKTVIKLGTVTANYLVMELKGIGGHAIIKFGNVEYKFEDGKDANQHGDFSGDWQTAVIKLDQPVTGDQDILVMAGYKGNDDAGTIEIRRAEVYYVTTVDDTHLDVLGAWTDHTSGRYTIKPETGKVVISCNESPVDGYDAAVAWVDLGEGGYDHITLTVKGLKNHIAIFHVGANETEYKFENGQHDPFTGDTQTFTIDVKNLKGVIDIRVILDFQPIAGVNDDGGSVEITQAVFSKTAA